MDIEVDLHIHTTTSDSTRSFQKALAKADKCDLKAVSFVDHNIFGDLDAIIANAIWTK